MRASTNRQADRAALLKLADALQVTKTSLRRDPCGDWNLFGRRGHVFTDGAGGLYVYLRLETKRHWESAKRNLAFMVLRQDGDDEGVFKICDDLSADQAGVLRRYVGLRKAQALTEERWAVLRGFKFAPAIAPLSGEIIDVSGDGGYPPTDAAAQ
jgi:hypothetical protein